MSDERLKILLMGYIDGELSDVERAEVDTALKADAGLREEHQSMVELKELTAGFTVDQRTDAELEAYWSNIYNRLERHTGWVLLLVGCTVLFLIGVALFLADADVHWGVKTACACAGVGMFALLWSVWRERQRVLPHDRYTKEVHR
jgi:hypothetical protein